MTTTTTTTTTTKNVTIFQDMYWLNRPDESGNLSICLSSGLLLFRDFPSSGESHLKNPSQGFWYLKSNDPTNSPLSLSQTLPVIEWVYSFVAAKTFRKIFQTFLPTRNPVEWFTNSHLTSNHASCSYVTCYHVTNSHHWTLLLLEGWLPMRKVKPKMVDMNALWTLVFSHAVTWKLAWSWWPCGEGRNWRLRRPSCPLFLAWLFRPTID